MELDIKKLSDFCHAYSVSTDLPISVIKSEGEEILSIGNACGHCGFCTAYGELKEIEEACKRTRLYGSYSSLRFAGRYIFFCHLGLTLIATPIQVNDKMLASIIAGPLLMIEKEEFISEIQQKQEELTNATKLLEEAQAIVYVNPERVHALSELLFMGSSYLYNKLEKLDSIHENQKLSGLISDYISKIKGEQEAKGYPLQKENELLDAMSRGDIISAKKLLNEIMGFIYFYSGFKFDIIRSRILELIVLISRAAVKGGADTELIFGLNYEYLKEIDQFTNIDDLTYWLSIVMNRFTDYVFNFVGAKHADIIFKATEYIKANYMKKMTLDEVSNFVYLSPSYFSKVFKDETGLTFSSYLNKIRIEQSKKLLRNDSINLSDIAYLVGYEDQSYFSKVFKKHTGMSPLKYRLSQVNK